MIAAFSILLPPERAREEGLACNAFPDLQGFEDATPDELLLSEARGPRSYDGDILDLLSLVSESCAERVWRLRGLTRGGRASPSDRPSPCGRGEAIREPAVVTTRHNVRKRVAVPARALSLGRVRSAQLKNYAGLLIAISEIPTGRSVLLVDLPSGPQRRLSIPSLVPGQRVHRASDELTLTQRRRGAGAAACMPWQPDSIAP
jgi:hypothetical protein